MAKTPRSYESFVLINGNPGDVFYTEKPDKDMTASAVYYKRKIVTEKYTCITSNDEVKKLFKVTIII